MDAAIASTSESTSEGCALTPQGKPNLRPWQPGQSGNPSGRRDKGLVAYINDQTLNGTELVDFVLSVLRDRNASTRHRLEAAEWLADRGFRRPALSVEPTGEPYFVFEWIEHDLNDALTAAPCSGWDEFARRFAVPILDALAPRASTAGTGSPSGSACRSNRYPGSHEAYFTEPAALAEALLKA